MKITLVDSSMTGHRIRYLESLTQLIKEIGFSYLRINSSHNNKYSDIQIDFPIRKTNLHYYIKRYFWLQKVIKSAIKEKSRVIHFLSLDSFYQLGGIGLRKKVKQKNIYILSTLHHIPTGSLRWFLLRSCIKKFNKVIVHSEYLKNLIVSHNIPSAKIEVIHYPVFHNSVIPTSLINLKNELNPKGPVLLALGGTRKGKGLDYLLEALKRINKDFLLIIAGKEEYFKKNYIKNEILSYKTKVHLDLRFLSDIEFGQYLDLADCVILPYRKGFDGASGPMTEAVWRRKTIIAPNYGNLGYEVNNFKLGYVFKAEDVESLTETIDSYLINSDISNWNQISEKYRKRLNVESFKEEHLRLYQNI
jgi:glycosyltransferase involved in cell wall biosynthesis